MFSCSVMGPNKSLDNLLQLAQTVCYGKEYEEKKERQRKTKEQEEAFAMSMKTVLKQPEKNAQRGPDEKGWACYYCGKEVNSLTHHTMKPSSFACETWKE